MVDLLVALKEFVLVVWMGVDVFIIWLCIHV